VIWNFARVSALAVAMAISGPATAQQDLGNVKSELPTQTQNKNWSGEVQRTERGFLIGNPDAKVKMIEFVSYTCGVCAMFAKQGDPAIDLSLVGPGDMSVEIRPVIRNELDLAITLLVNCGDPAKFKSRHSAFLWSQNSWLQKAGQAPQSQQAIWQRGDANARLNASNALNLGSRVIALGTTETEVTACLSDDKAAQKLLDDGKANRAEFGVTSTPSFALDGNLLKDVHQWATLYPILAERFKPTPSTNGGLSGSR